MTKIEQYDWGKLTPGVKAPKQEYIGTEGLYWRYKKGVPPTATQKHGKVKVIKPKDSSLFTDHFKQIDHLRAISKEEI